jgi:hypothetical protein
MSIPDFVIRHQARAWEAAHLLHKLNDTVFPYSGHYAPSQPIQDYFTEMVLLTGRAVGHLFSSSQASSCYEEKISLPFLYAAWDRLSSTGQLREQVTLGHNVFLTSVPSSMLYPQILHEDMCGHHAIVFNPSLFYMYVSFLNSIVALGERTLSDSKLTLLNIYRLTNALEAIMDDCLRQFGESLINMLTNGLPSTTHPVAPERIAARSLVACRIDDIYTFFLAHEIHHIDPQSPSSGSATQEAKAWMDEFNADLWALSVTVNSSPVPLDTLGVYLSISTGYHVMSYVYRAVHLWIHKADYGHLPPEVLLDIYLANGETHLHPLTRLMQLRHAVRQIGDPLPEKLDEYDKAVDMFCEWLWKPIAIWIMWTMTEYGQTVQLCGWESIIEWDRRVYKNRDRS